MPTVSKSGLTPNNSKGTTHDIKYKRLNERALLRTTYSSELRTYYVNIYAKHSGNRIDVSDVFDEYHPLMAIGRAVVKFRTDNFLCEIERIEIYERILNLKK